MSALIIWLTAPAAGITLGLISNRRWRMRCVLDVMFAVLAVPCAAWIALGHFDRVDAVWPVSCALLLIGKAGNENP